MAGERLMQNNAIIENLTWVLDSPSLLLPTPFLSSQPCQLQPAFFTMAQITQQYSPEEIIEKFTSIQKQTNDKRLGAFFECLVVTAIDLHPQLELIHWRLPLEDTTTGQRGGELDVLLFNSESQLVEHGELACKFYLQQGLGDKTEDWVGAHKNDLFDLKLDHLFKKQLPLIFKPQHKKQIYSYIEPYMANAENQPLQQSITQRIFLKGKLFSNHLQPCKVFPETINPLCSTHYTWQHWAEFHKTNNLKDWLKLDKKFWPCSTASAQKHGSVAPNNLDYAMLCQHKNSHSQCFLVENNW